MKSIMLGIIPLLLLATPALANAQTRIMYNETSHESGPITITSMQIGHVEFKDFNGNKIHMMYQNTTGSMGGMAMGSGVDNNTRYNQGYAQGLAGIKIKGHHTEPFLNGYYDGKIAVEDKIARQNPKAYGYPNGISDGQRSAMYVIHLHNIATLAPVNIPTRAARITISVATEAPPTPDILRLE